MRGRRSVPFWLTSGFIPLGQETEGNSSTVPLSPGMGFGILPLFLFAFLSSQMDDASDLL